MTSTVPAPLRFDSATMYLSDGRAVIEIGEAMGAHPNPSQNGKIVPISTVDLLLVESPSGEPVELYACNWPEDDKICGWVADNCKSVTSHQVYHSPTKGGSHYNIETLKLLIRTVKLFKRDGMRGYAQATAAVLNEQNIPTAKGEPWTGQSVSSLYNHWEPQIPVRVYRKRSTDPVSSPPANTKEVKVPTAAPKVTGVAPSPVARIGRLFDDIAARLNDAQTMMNALQTEVIDLAVQVEKHGAVNDEIREKAEKYDALRSMLGQ